MLLEQGNTKQNAVAMFELQLKRLHFEQWISYGKCVHYLIEYGATKWWKGFLLKIRMNTWCGLFWERGT